MTFDDYCKATGHYAEAGDRAMWEAATKAEREACAKGCEQLSHIGSENQLWMRDRCAAFIRSRSNA